MGPRYYDANERVECRPRERGPEWIRATVQWDADAPDANSDSHPDERISDEYQLPAFESGKDVEFVGSL